MSISQLKKGLQIKKMLYYSTGVEGALEGLPLKDRASNFLYILQKNFGYPPKFVFGVQKVSSILFFGEKKYFRPPS